MENEQLVFRAAALLASSWVQDWMQASGRVWFTPQAGPFRDVPVPARLWDLYDRESLRLEKLARELWAMEGEESDKKRSRRMKELDQIITKMMEALTPCR